jgi:glycosyltransferase involved in cell wall biosynthesis
VWQEATSLQRAGFGVAVICPKKKIYKTSYERLEGVDIYRYPLVIEANNGVAGYFVEFIYCWLASLWLAAKAYVHRPFHAIHACNPPDTFFALALLFRPLGVKFIFDHHDLCPEMYVAKGKPNSGVLYRGLLLLEKLTLRSAHLVIAVNESHRQIASRRGGIDDGKIVVVRSGPRLKWAEMSTADGSIKRGRAHLVVYLGEMCEQDGVDHLLRAIQHYASTYERDTLFAFIGGGPDQPRMKTLADAMGLGEWVHFTGRVSDEVLWQYLATADVGIDPDPWTEWSNLSTMNKVIEYMAFGKPIVAFDLAEHRRSAERAAIYVTPNDDIELSRSIRELLLDPNRRCHMSTFARQRFVEHLAWEHSEVQLLAAYSALLDITANQQAVSVADVAKA